MNASLEYFVRSLNRVFLALALSLCFWFVPESAGAHGIWGHIHVTGWAIENLPDGELRDFFSDPEVFNAALYGACFTDSGYFLRSADLEKRARAYGEHTHWEPFVQDYIEWMQENDPPPWDSLESRKRAAFLMGCASHGFQDEFFDSVFLHQIEARDQGDQEAADGGTDGFLFDADLIRFVPEEYIPMDILMELYSSLDEEVSEEIIEKSVKMMHTLYMNNTTGKSVALAFDEEYADELPWTKAHFLDPSIPGSLRAEILPTGAYMQAIWERMHAGFDPDEVVIFSFPEAGRPLLGSESESVDSWVTLIYGAGIHQDSVEGTWKNEEGKPLAFELAGSRWGASYSRLQSFRPAENLVPGSQHSIGLAAGLQLVDGTQTKKDYSLDFRVGCSDSEDTRCPKLSERVAPSLDGSGAPEGLYDPPEEISDAEEGQDSEDPDAIDSAESSGAGSGCSIRGGPLSSLPLVVFFLFLLVSRRPSAFGRTQA